ncbi:MAG: cobalamin B12-binding domain-containing protein [Peptococcaceae bacterium]|nr:cobalamin B12-binding domain-containing protein [Peptococcaceae bacterium]
MRILLLQPRPSKGPVFKQLIQTEPLGLEVVAASLSEHEVRILDLFNDRRLTNEITAFKPDVVGISCSFTVDVYKTLAIAQLVKTTKPDVFLFIGGHHASLKPEDFYHPAIDAVVIGDGEAAAPYLVNALERGEDLTKVAGLAVNTPEGQVLTPERPLVVDLDEVPIPNRELTKRYRNKYYLGTRRPFNLMETSRGCPYHCNFCSIWRFHRGKIRFMSPERVVEEVKTLPPGDVLFTDDNFLIDIDRSFKIADLIARSKLPRRRYIFQARSDTIIKHPDVIKKWAEVGLDNVFIGFEKIDQDGLNAINKRNSVQNNEKALKFLQSLNIGVYASFIVDPQFTRQEFRKLIEYVRRLKISQPYFSVLTPLPGTELYQQVKERITTMNYNLYDLLHAVLPTKISVNQFYQEFANLYRKTYLSSRNTAGTLKWFITRLISGKLSLSHLLKLLEGIRLTTDYRAYLTPEICPCGTWKEEK